MIRRAAMLTNKQLLKMHSLTARQKAMFFSKNLAFLLSNSRFLYSPAVPAWARNEYETEVADAYRYWGKVERSMTFPKSFNLMMDFGLYLYYVIRSTKPAVVVETGAGNGYSSRIILAALGRNRKGTLYTVDVERGVAKLVGDRAGGRWRLIIGKPRATLTRLLDRIGRVDVFLHDSDHSYGNMMFEFRAAWKKMKNGSYLMSDDINVNRAFMDFADVVGVRPRVIASYRRSFGILGYGSHRSL